jgi:hypothetical protein
MRTLLATVLLLAACAIPQESLHAADVGTPPTYAGSGVIPSTPGTCQKELVLDGSSTPRYRYRTICNRVCKINLFLPARNGKTSIDVEWTDPRVSGPEYAAQVARCKSQVEGGNMGQAPIPNQVVQTPPAAGQR